MTGRGSYITNDQPPSRRRQRLPDPVAAKTSSHDAGVSARSPGGDVNNDNRPCRRRVRSAAAAAMAAGIISATAATTGARGQGGGRNEKKRPRLRRVRSAVGAPWAAATSSPRGEATGKGWRQQRGRAAHVYSCHDQRHSQTAAGQAARLGRQRARVGGGRGGVSSRGGHGAGGGGSGGRGRQ